jgi:aconitate hydratase
MDAASDPAMYGRLYADARAGTPLWQEIQSPGGVAYAWDPASTYIREPPFFESFARTAAPSGDVLGARALAIFGDSVTTDHISPAGSIKASSPAARYLEALGVDRADFNSYGARRGNHEVMVRGTFGNVRIKNLMVRGTEGGMTAHQPDGERMTIFDAAQRYAREGVPLVVLAGREYGTGSSRDWAAKGPRLLGVRAIVARSFERIHRSNLVGMGVLPCQFAEGAGAETWGLDGTERYDLRGVAGLARPLQAAKLIATRRDGVTVEIPVTVRIDTPIEVEYWRHGGILPYTLRHLLGES